ncbi:MAG: hypothetical protein NZ874_04260 [Fimbriimonadales bacterium]|nr:hypothetical protein [Fimbriimonadales bacterium]
MILLECLNHWLRRYGEPFQVGAFAFRGLFFQPPGSWLRWYFSPEQLTELPRPLWAVAVAPTVDLSEDTAVVWRDANYRVLRQLEFRMRETPIYRVILLQPEPEP